MHKPAQHEGEFLWSMFMIAMMMSIINNYTRLKNASYTIINDILKKLNAKDELDDTIEKLNEAQIRQIV